MRYTKDDEDEDEFFKNIDEDKFFKTVAIPFVIVGVSGVVFMLLRILILK